MVTHAFHKEMHKQLSALLARNITLLQAGLVCLVAKCTADSSRWEAGLRHCENAMGVLPSAAHLPISKWKVPAANVYV